MTLVEIENIETAKPLPEGWHWARLGEVCEFTYGSSLPEIGRKKGVVPVYGSNGIVGYHDKSIIHSPTLIIGRKGSIGEVNYSRIPCWPIDTTYYIDDSKTSCNLDWLFFLLKFMKLSTLNKASGVPGLNRDDAYNQKIPLPPLAEQLRIAKILNEQMAAVEKARTAAEARLAAAKALPAAYLREVFPQPGQELPKGWRWSQLKDVCKQDKNIIDFKNERRNNLDFIGLENIESGTGKINLIPKLKLASNSTTFFFDSRHILYGKLRPYLNKVALPNFKGQCTTELVPLLVEKEINRDFIAWIIRREETIEAVMKEKTGSRMPRADMDILLSVVFPIPISHVEQERIITLLNSRIAKTQNIIQKTQQELDIINALPATILRRAFSGGL